MARGAKAKNKPKAVAPIEPLVNKFAARHGDYVQAGEYGDARLAMVNRGGTALTRWIKSGQLTESQQAAILHCQRLWRLAFHLPNVVANLDRVSCGETRDDPRSIDARIDIKRIEGGFPKPYWYIFENVCRHGEAAGRIGSNLVSDTRSASTHARLVVCMVADMIALRERLSY
jgi:hypothetical protein